MRKLFTRLVICLLLFSGVFFLLYKGLANKYRYDVSADYRYAFQNSEHTRTEVKLEQGGFQLTKNNIPDNAFLEVNLDATFSGYFFEPSVEIVTGGSRAVQTLERGVSGLRYLNISPLLNSGSRDFQITGRHLEIKDPLAQLYMFHNKQNLQQSRIMVIAPHPDDAEIAAFGLYSDKNALIVTITAGDAGEYNYDEIYPEIKQHYLQKGKLRVWNSITVPMLGGIDPDRAINLGYFDGTLLQMYQNKGLPVTAVYSQISDINIFRKQNISDMVPESSGKANWYSLVSDLRALLKAFQPNIIVAPYPALDSHTDHKVATLALIEAIQALCLKKGSLFLYTNHFSLNDYFPYGQTGELVTIPPDFKAANYFDRIVSYNLHKPDEKLLALEAMNDLRLDTEWRTVKGVSGIMAAKVLETILFKERSYFRRAVRANELFLVVDIENLYREEVISSLRGSM